MKADTTRSTHARSQIDRTEAQPHDRIEPPPPPMPTIVDAPEIARAMIAEPRRGASPRMMEALVPDGPNVLRRVERHPIETRALLLGALSVGAEHNITGASNALIGAKTATGKKAKASLLVTPGASIIDLVSKDEGWKDVQWLLQRADAAPRANGVPGAANDGKVSVAELIGYIENPLDGAALTSSRMHEIRTAVAQGGNGSVAISSLSPWQQTVARYAAGSSSPTITLAQLDTYLTDARSDQPTGKTRWITNNSLAAVISGLRFADQEPGADFLALKPIAVPNPAGGQPNFQTLLDPYKRMIVDLNTKNPVAVSYVLDAADMQLTIPRGRKSSFHNDPQLGNKLATTQDYANSGMDQGHCAPDDDFRFNALAEWASYTMANMMPQQPDLNRDSWRLLEEQIRQKVAASGGRAVVHTGPLYTDDTGKLVPPQQLQHMGVHKDVAIPTHCWKVVLFQDQSGKNLEAWSVVMPNTSTLPTSGPSMQQLIDQGHRALGDVEKLIGFDVLSALPDAAKQALHAGPKATTTLPAGTNISLIGAPPDLATAPQGPRFNFAATFPDLAPHLARAQQERA
jgi:DNA/RNA endonuclease G (NUC1)